MWRFAPLGDDQVDVLLSRDLDSEILKREYDAVSEWLNSTNKSLHIMRDHPFHCVPMLGGMWGIRTKKPLDRRRLWILRQQMFQKGFNDTETRNDQSILMEILWPEFKTDFIAHDSYCCDEIDGSSPFPTRREDGKYVGAAFISVIKLSFEGKSNFNFHIQWQQTVGVGGRHQWLGES
ncbi:hypothetical protein Avbf_11655 [Armadillidium vulgare]|nr:hypothetical protein Avbf_11655 [Armadillidium vulgare]